MSRLSSVRSAIPIWLAVAALVAPLRASAMAQYSLNGNDLVGVLAPGGGLVSFGAVVGLASVRPTLLRNMMGRYRVVAAGLLVVGGLVAAAAPALALQLIGSLFVGMGAGLLIAVTRRTFAAVVGFAVGPALGMLAASVAWRAPFIVAVIAGLATYGLVTTDTLADSGRDSTYLTRPANVIAFSSACALIFGYISWARYDEITRPSTVASQTALVLTLGALLGLWRGRALDRRGVGRRAIRHGCWCVLISGMSTGLFFHLLPDLVRALEPMLLAFGLSKILAASARSVTPVAVGSGVAAVVASVVSSGNGLAAGLPATIADLSIAYPKSAATLAQLRAASNSLPLTMNIARDPRTGPFASAMRAAVRAEIGGFLAVNQFMCVALAVLCFAASFVIPRHRTIAARRYARNLGRVGKPVLSSGHL